MIYKKILISIICIFLSIEIFSESIISGFGIFYKTPYEEGLKQIEEDGLIILKQTNRRDSNTDRKIIEVDSFEYEYLPYKSGTFCFDRDIDGKYYFTIAEGDVDTDKIDSDLEYASKFHLFLEESKRKYILEQEDYSDMQLIGFKGDNEGYILLSITEKLHIMYFPKAPLK